MYCLIDCNNFFVSCERVFQPHLKNKPVAVLSRNDGCIIARSNEVKKLGIPMGAPVFKWREVIEKAKVQLFSSNFELYGDFSARVMHTLELFSKKIEIYSIDEAFIEAPKIKKEKLLDYGKEIHDCIYQYTGIPVSVGISPTKTLCKIATEFAKKLNQPTFMMHPSDRFFNEKLKQIPIGDIWGVGRVMAPKMMLRDLLNAFQLKEADPFITQKEFGIFGSRLIYELRGQPCFTENNHKKLKKSIRFTRSFSKAIYKKGELKKILVHFTAMAAEKLRAQQSKAQLMTVFLSTSKHDESKYYKSIQIRLDHPSYFSPDFIKAASDGFEKIFKSGKAYKRAGVTLMGIFPENYLQHDLLNQRPPSKNQQSQKLMKTLDHINKKFGKGSLHFLSEGFSHHAHKKSSSKSPEFSTNWNDLLTINIDR